MNAILNFINSTQIQFDDRKLSMWKRLFSPNSQTLIINFFWTIKSSWETNFFFCFYVATISLNYITIQKYRNVYLWARCVTLPLFFALIDETIKVHTFFYFIRLFKKTCRVSCFFFFVEKAFRFDLWERICFFFLCSQCSSTRTPEQDEKKGEKCFI